MSDEYIVLRLDGTGRKEVMVGLLGGERPPDFRLGAATEDLTEHDAVDIARDDRVFGAAPSMPVALIEPLDVAQPADTGGEVTWGLDAVGATQSELTGAGVTVAVLDSGIESDHKAFVGGPEIVVENFTDDADGSDVDGHGTHCAGTIFGGAIDGLRIGVAPGIERALIGKVIGPGGGSTAGIVKGLLWAAEEGATVISMSLGFDFPKMVERAEAAGRPRNVAVAQALAGYSQNVQLFDRLAALVRGRSAMFSRTIVIAAAGNESERPHFVLPTAPPAAADGILSVGALASSDGSADGLTVAPFSNSGPDVCAPGVDIRSAGLGGTVASKSGTSMATPHVAGVAALWAERLGARDPDYKISQLQARLVGTADPMAIGSEEKPADYGAGLVRAP